MPGMARSCCVVHPRDRVGPGGHDVGRRSIRANLERVVALDFEQVGNLGQDLCDRLVIHATSPWRSIV